MRSSPTLGVAYSCLPLPEQSNWGLSSPQSWCCSRVRHRRRTFAATLPNSPARLTGASMEDCHDVFIRRLLSLAFDHGKRMILTIGAGGADLLHDLVRLKRISSGTANRSLLLVDFEGLSTADQRVNLAPQRPTFLAFGRRQLAQRGRVEQPGQVGVVPPGRQRLPSLDAIRLRAGVHLLGPGGQVKSQPVSRLFAQRFPLRLPEPGHVVAMTAAGQGGGAGGVESVTGAEVLGQLGCGCERLGIEASGRGVVLLDETEFRQVKAVGGGGLVLSLDDGGKTTFQGAERLAALQ